MVEVDRLGQAQRVAPANIDYQPTDAQIAYHLARFIEDVRGLPADGIVLRQNWLRAYDFTTDRGAAALNDFARNNDPFAKLGKAQISVDVSSVIRASSESFRVAWTQRIYENGSLIIEAHRPEVRRHLGRRTGCRARLPAASQGGGGDDGQIVAGRLAQRLAERGLAELRRELLALPECFGCRRFDDGPVGRPPCCLALGGGGQYGRGGGLGDGLQAGCRGSFGYLARADTLGYPGRAGGSFTDAVALADELIADPLLAGWLRGQSLDHCADVSCHRVTSLLSGGLVRAGCRGGQGRSRRPGNEARSALGSGARAKGGKHAAATLTHPGPGPVLSWLPGALRVRGAAESARRASRETRRGGPSRGAARQPAQVLGHQGAGRCPAAAPGRLGHEHLRRRPPLRLSSPISWPPMSGSRAMMSGSTASFVNEPCQLANRSKVMGMIGWLFQVDELDDIVNALDVAEHAIAVRQITLIADRASRRPPPDTLASKRKLRSLSRRG